MVYIEGLLRRKNVLKKNVGKVNAKQLAGRSNHSIVVAPGELGYHFHADKDAIEPVGGGSAFDAEIRAVAVEDSAFGVVDVIPKPHELRVLPYDFKPCGKQREDLADIGLERLVMPEILKVAPGVCAREHFEHLLKVSVAHSMLTAPSSVTTLLRLSTLMFSCCRSSGLVPI